VGTIPADLLDFLATNRDSREYRRALAVRLVYEGYTYDTVGAIVDLSPGSISTYVRGYQRDGVAALTLKYTGRPTKLTDAQRAEVIAWLKQATTWSLQQLRIHLETTYQVSYQSDQSYYDLLHAAGLTYKRTQPQNPERNPEHVAAKKKRFN
jgi:putative transposase